MLAQSRLVEVSAIVTLLAKAGAEPIVLKGLPLSMSLYGDISARPVNDTDLFIPLEHRAAAHHALVGAGFGHRVGIAPLEGSYYRREDGRMSVVEVHSSLLDDNLVAHLRLPAVEATTMEIEGVTVRAHSGPLVPVFLAVHLAKHAEAPLLWWLDLATLWATLSVEQRAASRELAARHRVERFLAWAEGGVQRLREAQLDDPALAAAGMRALRALHATHPVRRIGTLSSSWRDRLASQVAWMWPREMRRTPLAFARTIAARVVRRATRGRRIGVPEIAVAPVSELRGLSVSDGELLALAREVMALGAPLWIRAHGTSMQPTIKNGALVRIIPLGQRPLRPGDVVLAEMEGAKAVIHRVHSSTERELVLKGDNMIFPDAPLAPAAAIALVDTVQQDTMASRIGRRAPNSLRHAIARFRIARRAPAVPRSGLS